jgi:hypothetical protein
MSLGYQEALSLLEKFNTLTSVYTTKLSNPKGNERFFLHYSNPSEYGNSKIKEFKDLFFIEN